MRTMCPGAAIGLDRDGAVEWHGQCDRQGMFARGAMDLYALRIHDFRNEVELGAHVAVLVELDNA